MCRRMSISLVLAVPLLLSRASFAAPGPPNHERAIWNYDGGLQLLTDGALPSGACFRINGRATAPGDYFSNLKRVDTDTGTLIHRGSEIVTRFPDLLHLSFVMYDFPCDMQLQNAGNRTYLTRATVGTLRLSFYWKRGVALRPATGVVPQHFEVRPIAPYATELADQLPQRFEWEFAFDVPSAGVPVTDSLVVILRAPDGHIAARAAARM